MRTGYNKMYNVGNGREWPNQDLPIPFRPSLHFGISPLHPPLSRMAAASGGMFGLLSGERTASAAPTGAEEAGITPSAAPAPAALSIRYTGDTFLYISCGLIY